MDLLGLDIGTTGCKAIVFNPDGAILGSGFREYSIIHDRNGKAEQDAEKVWNLTCSAIGQAVSESPTNNIGALSLSVQGDAIIPVDKDFKPLHNAILGMDYRSIKQVREIENIFGPVELFNMTGMRPHPMNSLSKILWLRDNEYEAYKKAWKIMTYADFILGRLGADPVIDHTMASRTMAFGLEDKKWSGKILNRMDINMDLFSDARPSGEAVSKISKKIAGSMGLDPETLLVTGGHDQACAALGSGVVKEGTGIISTGTAEVLSTAFPQPVLNKVMFDSFYPCYLYVKKGMYFTFSLNHVGGLLLRWFRDNFSGSEIDEAKKSGSDIYELLISRIPGGPSKILFLPHLNGSGTPWCDMLSKGAIVGLKMSTTKYDIVRAILESQAYELKINLEAMEKAGIKIDELNAVGGGARSPAWLQIKANILNRPVNTLRTREAASLGAAILAGSAAGLYGSIAEGVEMTVKSDNAFYPDEKIVDEYHDRFLVYKELYPALASINERLD